MEPDVRVFPELDALSHALAEIFVGEARQAVTASGSCTVALSGGSTPRRLYRLLAFGYGDRLDWSAVRLFMGDERYVPPEDPLSNFRMVKETLLEHLPIPPENVHPMPTGFPAAADAAAAYEATLRVYFAGEWPRFDVAFLGMGADGHTASLFPLTPSLEDTARWVVPTIAPTEPVRRLSLTLPVFNQARHVHFLVAGPNKADALREVLMHPDTTAATAARIHPVDGHVTWWVDEAAAASVDRSILRSAGR